MKKAYIIKTTETISEDILEHYDIELLAGDVNWALVYGEYDDVQELAQKFYVHALLAKAGRYMDSGGDCTYIDNNADIDVNAVGVLKSLIDDSDPQALAAKEELGDGIQDIAIADGALEIMGRAF